MTGHPPVVVRVTEEDILDGLPRRADACPIARAASRAMRSPVVAGRHFLYALGGATARYRTPPIVEGFLAALDRGDPVEPFSFIVAKPEVFG